MQNILGMIATKQAAVSAIQLLLYEHGNLENVSNLIRISKSNISRYLSGQILPSVEVTEKTLRLVREQGYVKKWAESLIQVRTIGSNRVVDPSMILAYPRILYLLVFELLYDFGGLNDIDFVVSAEVEGLTFALTAARILEIPLVYARRKKPLVSDYKQIEMIKPSSGTIENLYLPQSLIEKKKQALFVDDVIRTGATAAAIKNALNENRIRMNKALVLVKFKEVKIDMTIKSIMII